MIKERTVYLAWLAAAAVYPGAVSLVLFTCFAGHPEWAGFRAGAPFGALSFFWVWSHMAWPRRKPTRHLRVVPAPAPETPR